MDRNFAMAECGFQGYFMGRVQLGQIYSDIPSYLVKLSRL